MERTKRKIIRRAALIAVIIIFACIIFYIISCIIAFEHISQPRKQLKTIPISQDVKIEIGYVPGSALDPRVFQLTGYRKNKKVLLKNFTTTHDSLISAGIKDSIVTLIVTDSDKMQKGKKDTLTFNANTFIKGL